MCMYVCLLQVVIKKKKLRDFLFHLVISLHMPGMPFPLLSTWQTPNSSFTPHPNRTSSEKPSSINLASVLGTWSLLCSYIHQTFTCPLKKVLLWQSHANPKSFSSFGSLLRSWIKRGEGQVSIADAILLSVIQTSLWQGYSGPGTLTPSAEYRRRSDLGPKDNINNYLQHALTSASHQT